METIIMYAIGIIMALSGIMNVYLICFRPRNRKKDFEKRMELVEQMREYNKKHKKGE